MCDQNVWKLLDIDPDEATTFELPGTHVFARNPVMHAIITISREIALGESLTDLNLSNQGLGPYGTLAMADALKDLRPDTLTALDLSNNSIGFAGPWKTCLADNHPVTHGITAITTLIARFELLTCLDISSNKLCAAGGRAFASALDEHPALTWLNLSNNMLGRPHIFTTTEVDASGLVAVFGALETAVPTLTGLDTGGNHETAYPTEYKGWKKDPEFSTVWEHEDGQREFEAPKGLISESAESLARVVSQKEALTVLNFGTADELGILSGNPAPFRLSTPANLYTIEIGSEYFGCSGAVILKAWLAQHGATVDTLHIQESALLSAEAGKVLSLILKQNTSITDLQLSNTTMNDRELYETDRDGFVKELCDGMGMLQKLNLSKNYLDVYCATLLADALHQNHIMTELDLSQNHLAECCQGFPYTSGVSRLANAIATMSALTRLDMSHNRLYVDGGKALIPGLKDNKVMTELNLENNRFTFVNNALDFVNRRPSEGEKTYSPDESGGVSELLDAIGSMTNLTKVDLTFNRINIEQLKEFAPFQCPLFPRDGPPRQVAKSIRIPVCCNCQDVFAEEEITFMSECLHMVCPTCLDNLEDCCCPVCHKENFCDE